MAFSDKDGVIVLGDSPTPSNNITIKTPVVPDGSLEIYQGVPGALGSKIGRITPNGIEGGIQLSTPVTLTNQTFVDFAVPAGAKRVTVMLAGVSTNGTSLSQVQLGHLGGIVAAGYAGSTGVTAHGTGFLLWQGSLVDSTIMQSTLTLNKLSDNTWVSEIASSFSTTSLSGNGTVNVPGPLTTVRITTVNGTDQFDAGTVNISWEL